MSETTNLQLGHDSPMSVEQAAAYLQVTPSTIDRYVRTLDLPAHKLGPGLNSPKRFYRSELDAWIKNRCSDNTPAREVATKRRTAARKGAETRKQTARSASTCAYCGKFFGQHTSEQWRLCEVDALAQLRSRCSDNAPDREAAS